MPATNNHATTPTAALAQAITFASADRFKMLGSYFNVTAGEGVNHST